MGSINDKVLVKFILLRLHQAPGSSHDIQDIAHSHSLQMYGAEIIPASISNGMMPSFSL
jgi:hypothetical protein